MAEFPSFLSIRSGRLVTVPMAARTQDPALLRVEPPGLPRVLTEARVPYERVIAEA